MDRRGWNCSTLGKLWRERPERAQRPNERSYQLNGLILAQSVSISRKRFHAYSFRQFLTAPYACDISPWIRFHAHGRGPMKVAKLLLIPVFCLAQLAILGQETRG